MTSRQLRSAIALAAAVIGATGVGAQDVLTEDEVRRQMDVISAHRVAGGVEQLMIAPYYTVDKGNAQLVLTNRFSYPLSFSVDAFSESGRRLHVADLFAESRQQVVLDLQPALSSGGPDHRTGTLRVSYFGDAEMAQAWLLLGDEDDQHVAEFPLTKRALHTASQFKSFWSLDGFPRLAGLRPRYRFVNLDAEAVTIEIEGVGDHPGRVSLRRTLGPFATLLLEPHRVAEKRRNGALIIDHNGKPGQVLVGAILEGWSGQRAQLPVLSPSAGKAGDRFESMILNDPARGIPGEDFQLVGSVFDLRSSGALAEVAAELVTASSGVVRARRTVFTEPGSVVTLPLRELSAAAAWHEQLRLRITSDETIAPIAFFVGSDGHIAEAALLPHTKAHESGTYPLPDLRQNRVVATFVNVGAAPAEIVAQMDWEEGSFALPPFSVPAGASYRLAINELAESGQADLLGRTLDVDLRQGFFQWSSRLGSSSLLARTEVFPATTPDFYGFNCFGCCPEQVWGGTVPQSIVFDLGQAPSFTASEWIQTCTGTMGPYVVSSPTLSYSTPLSWDGHAITSQDYTGQTVSFTARETVVLDDCRTREMLFGGGGRVDVDECQKAHNPGYDPSKGCIGMFKTCGTCKSCCDRETAVANCRCDKLFFNSVCKRNALAACQKCKEQCVGNNADSCSDGSTSCS